jgi:hypothetical protein
MGAGTRSGVRVRADIARVSGGGEGDDGTVPTTCASYSELHDYVDANGYGGAFEHDFDNEETDFWNAVQDAVDAWIKTGGLKS